MKVIESAILLTQVEIAPGIYDMVLSAPQIAAQAQAGQFVAVYSNDASRLLPRPISLCGFDAREGTIRMVYRIAGAGTEEFSKMRTAQTLRVMGPLGNGFSYDGGSALIVGGGIGLPPMLGFARQIRAKHPDAEITIVLGYRDAQTFLLDEFEAVGDVAVATEDGSVGTPGNVLDAIRLYGLEADTIYACGPKPMLRALKDHALSHGMACYISMEERMACGIGACLACVCPTMEPDGHSHVHNARVCADGPVFDAREVDLS